MRSKLQKETVEKFLKWALVRLKATRAPSRTQETKDQANEMILGLELLSREAGVGKQLNQYKKEIGL